MTRQLLPAPAVPLLTNPRVSIALTTGQTVPIEATAKDWAAGPIPALIDEISWEWSKDHAAAHDNPAPTTLTLRMATPPAAAGSALPVIGLEGSEVTITATAPDGRPLTWVCWLNTWTAERSTGTAPNGVRPWRVHLELTDVIGRAAAVRVAWTPWLVDDIPTRIQLISNAIGHIVRLDYADVMRNFTMPKVRPRDVDSVPLLDLLAATLGSLTAFMRGGTGWLRMLGLPGASLVANWNDTLWAYGPEGLTIDASPVAPSALTDVPVTADRRDRFTRFVTEEWYDDGGRPASRRWSSEVPDTPWSTSELSKPADFWNSSGFWHEFTAGMILGIDPGTGQYYTTPDGQRRSAVSTVKRGHPRLQRVRVLPGRLVADAIVPARARSELTKLIDPVTRTSAAVMITPNVDGVTQTLACLGGRMVWHPDPSRHRLWLDLAAVAGGIHTEPRFEVFRDRIGSRFRSVDWSFAALANNSGIYA